MPELTELRRLREAADIRASNSADVQLPPADAERLRRTAATARTIIAALESDPDLENAAVQLAWCQVLELLMAGGDGLRECVGEIQKLCASGRARRSRCKTDPRQQELGIGGIKPETLHKIEDALKLL